MVMVPKKPHQGNDRGKRKPPHRILHLGSRFTALLALAFWAVTVPNAWAGAQGNHATVGSQIATPMDHLQEPSPSGPPITLTLQDALKRAEKYSPQFQAAVTAAKLAREDQVQARAAMLPSISYTTQYLNTQGNGISPVGRFVTNDGVHVYRACDLLFLCRTSQCRLCARIGPSQRRDCAARPRCNRHKRLLCASARPAPICDSRAERGKRPPLSPNQSRA